MDLTSSLNAFLRITKKRYPDYATFSSAFACVSKITRTMAVGSFGDFETTITQKNVCDFSLFSLQSMKMALFGVQTSLLAL
jgi:hypothetical protein